ncbi:MAG TPA: CHASE3 domain-containing protein [Gemmatimonadaceae bacterium]|nr:CHASE3 domain-containing protein [Gemmatimonadaceae bacterium]
MRLSLLGTAQRRALAMVPAVLLVFVAVFAYQRARRLIADVREVERSHAIIESSDAVLTRTVDAETGQRAYLLTGDEVFLQPFQSARQDIKSWLDSLRVLVRGYPRQNERVAEIAGLIPARFALLDSGIVLKRQGSPQAASVERLRTGKQTMDRMRLTIGALQSEERRMLEQRHIIEQRSVFRAAVAVGLAAAVALVLGALVNLFFSRAVRERDEAITDLDGVNKDLEHQSEQLQLQAVEMESQAAELEATAEELKATNDQLSRTMQVAEEARDAAESSRQQLAREQTGAKLLSDASRVLASTLDYEKTLQAVAKLAVGDLADWCGVDLVETTGAIRQVIVAHQDEAKVKWARELNKRYPPNYDGPTGVGNVIRSGTPQIYPDISDEMIVAAARDGEHLAIMRELQIRSALIVPMIARGKILGALTLISSRDGRHYGDPELSVAMELATRAAMAIDNAQLYRGALAASDAKSAFLATMSHELRTPLNAIIGYQSLLAEQIAGKLNESQIAQLSRIRASADHLLGLIDEVLTFSRVDAGKEHVRKEELELHAVVAAAVTMVTPLAAAKGLKLRDETADGRVVSDAGKVRQIMLNLLSNAIKFSDDGEIVVRSKEDDASITISVMDTGIGIAPENLDSIFDPFWQVEQRPTRRAGGTGLGLSVSRSLARLLGGDVTVQSRPAGGSTFNLVIPISPIDA